MAQHDQGAEGGFTATTATALIQRWDGEVDAREGEHTIGRIGNHKAHYGRSCEGRMHDIRVVVDRAERVTALGDSRKPRPIRAIAKTQA